MLMKMYYVTFFFTLMSGTILACSANYWFTCWLGLEINLMSLIPLLIIKLTPFSTETAIKYFLAQAMASLMIIFASLMDSSIIYSGLFNISSEIIMMALSIKAGMAPFHFWFPQVMKIANWAQCLMILTWQKIAPFVLILSTKQNFMVYLIIMSSALVGSLGGLNQMAVKNILTYSSIAHSAWMLSMCSTASFLSWLFYFLIYSLMSVMIVTIMYKTNVVTIKQTFFMKWEELTKISLMISLLSLGGLPPFLGFIAKLVAIQVIIYSMSWMVPVTLILASLISLYYYTRMTYPLILKTTKMNLIQTKNFNQLSYVTPVMVILGNMIAPLLMLLT